MDKHECFLLLLVLFQFAGCHVEGCANSTLVSQLTAALLSEYEWELRPPSLARGNGSYVTTAAPGNPEPNGPTKVALDLAVRHARIDESSGTAILVADLYMAWLDSRLMWNVSEWGTEAAYISSDAVWRPDVTILNAAKPATSDEPARVAVSSDGATLWVPRLELSVLCSLTMDYWPRDEHLCNFDFGSKTYNDKEIQYIFHPYEKGDQAEREVGAWGVNLLSSELVVVKREGAQYSSVRWTVAVRRRSGAQVVTSLAVTGVVVALIGCTLLAPPATRAPLHAAAVMTATVQLVMSALRLPPAAGAPRLLRLHAGLLGLAAAGAVCAAIVVRVAALDTRPASPTLRRLLLRTAFMSGYREEQKSEECCSSSPATTAVSTARAWAATAQLLDVVFSLLVCLVMIILLACYL